MFRKPTLEQRLIRLERLAIKFEAAGSELIYQDDLWDVYKVTTYADARQLGRGTNWGIAGKWDTDSYATNGVWSGEEFFNKQMKRFSGGIYIYVKKKSKDKYCILCKPNGSVAAVSNNDDDTIKPSNILLEEPDFPSISGVFKPPAVNKSARNIEALVNAIADGKTDTFNKLISSGIDVNARCSAGTAPLHVAIMYNRIDMVKALLEAGADPNLPGDVKYPGWTNPLKNAINDRRTALAALLKQYGAHE